MPDYSQFRNRQQVHTEDLQHLSDQMFDSFADEIERNKQLPHPPLVSLCCCGTAFRFSTGAGLAGWTSFPGQYWT